MEKRKPSGSPTYKHRLPVSIYGMDTATPTTYIFDAGGATQTLQLDNIRHRWGSTSGYLTTDNSGPLIPLDYDLHVTVNGPVIEEVETAHQFYLSNGFCENGSRQIISGPVVSENAVYCGRSTEQLIIPFQMPSHIITDSALIIMEPVNKRQRHFFHQLYNHDNRRNEFFFTGPADGYGFTNEVMIQLKESDDLMIISRIIPLLPDVYITVKNAHALQTAVEESGFTVTPDGEPAKETLDFYRRETVARFGTHFWQSDPARHAQFMVLRKAIRKHIDVRLIGGALIHEVAFPRRRSQEDAKQVLSALRCDTRVGEMMLNKLDELRYSSRTILAIQKEEEAINKVL